MFKKPINLQGQTLLKGSDRKRIREILKKNFPHLDQNSIDLLWPIKGNDKLTPLNVKIVEEIHSVKISGTHSIIYLVNKTPYFFDLTGRNDMLPSGTVKKLTPF
jgi:hypothetical protein